MKSYGITRSSIDENNDLSSHDGLLREYKKLNIQLKQLQILEKRTKDQLATLQEDNVKIAEEIQLYSNLEVNDGQSVYVYGKTKIKFVFNRFCVRKLL